MTLSRLESYPILTLHNLGGIIGAPFPDSKYSGAVAFIQWYIFPLRCSSTGAKEHQQHCRLTIRQGVQAGRSGVGKRPTGHPAGRNVFPDIEVVHCSLRSRQGGNSGREGLYGRLRQPERRQHLNQHGMAR